MRQSLQLRKPVRLTGPLGMIIVAGLIGLGGCASPNLAVGEAGVRQPYQEHSSAPSATSDIADFQMVECLLPPRIRRLGAQVVYLEPRHQMTTTSRDCAIRGGDTIASDAPKTAT
jgi:hypothetical protein